MKKRLLAGLAIAALIGATVVSPADARGGGGGGMGGGWHGGGGGWQGGGAWHGGGGNNSGNWHGGGNWNHGNWGGWHNSGFHGHGHNFHGSHFFGTSLFIGVPFAYWWGYPYWYWDPWYYGTYYGPTVVYDGYDGYPAGAPAVTPAPAPTGEVRWYCPDSGYYPTVRTCERGWMRVLPGGTPPASSQ
jgi:hypothetical protein